MRKIKFFQHSISNILTTIVAMVAGFLSVKLFVKIYTLEEYGAWVLVSGILASYIALDFGLGLSFQNFAIKHRVTSDKKLLANGFWISTVIVSIVGVVASLLVLILFDAQIFVKYFGIKNLQLAEKLDIPIKFFLVVSFLSSSFRISNSLLRSMHFSHLIEYQNLLRSFSLLVLLIICNYFYLNIDYLLYIIACFFFMIEATFFYFSLKIVNSLLFLDSISNIKKILFDLLSSSLYFFIQQLGFQSIQIGPIFFIAHFLDVSEAGRINPTLRIIGIISGIVAIGLGPFAAHFNENYHHQKHNEIIKIYNKLVYLISALAIICIPVIFYAGKFLIEIWVGKDFVYPNNFYLIVGILISCNIVISFFCTVFVGLEMQKKLAGIYTFFSISFLTLSFYLMPYYGLDGLLYVLTSIQIGLVLVLGFICHRNLKINHLYNWI